MCIIERAGLVDDVVRDEGAQASDIPSEHAACVAPNPCRQGILPGRDWDGGINPPPRPLSMPPPTPPPCPKIVPEKTRRDNSKQKPLT